MARPAKRQKLHNGTAVAAETTASTSEARSPAADLKPSEKPSEGQDSQTRRSLFVRALPPTTTSESLTELFSESYPVKHAIAVIDPETKQCRGYGFVTFADAEDAQRAKEEFQGRVWQDRKLRIEVAEPRHREEGAGGESGKSKSKPAREKAPPPSTKLIVRNLPWSIKGSTQLEKLFAKYGKVKQAYVPRKGARGLMAGFGFVVMKRRKDAEKALEGINGTEVDGRTVAVDWSVEKEIYHELTQHADAAEEANGAQSEAGAVDKDNEYTGEDDSGVEDDDGSYDMQRGDDYESTDEEVDEDVEVEMDVEEELDSAGDANLSEDKSSTLFVRNLPFTCTDEDLEDHFARFGSVRYARVVMDAGTGRSKGTGFVCFYKRMDADACLAGAPKRTVAPSGETASKKNAQPAPSILQDQDSDPSGQYTLDGRVLQVSRAVEKSEAERLAEESTLHRNKRNHDKRRLYLLSEGTISHKSKLWESLPPSEKTMREASLRQRKALLESNPSLHLSLTRLSIRNIPRSIGSKELKALAREAVVGFATDVKNGIRAKLSKEELARGGEEMAAAEAARRRAGKGVVKQAKVVFEGASGSKVREDSGAGRSRGYGFIEYYTHRSALMGLRWLNGHAVGYKVRESTKNKKHKPSREELQDRKKRLIVEFAIENAQVVMRRHEREAKARERVQSGKDGDGTTDTVETRRSQDVSTFGDGKAAVSRKRKRGQAAAQAASLKSKPKQNSDATEKKAEKPIDEKTARRNQIIGRKRAARKARKG